MHRSKEDPSTDSNQTGDNALLPNPQALFFKPTIFISAPRFHQAVWSTGRDWLCWGQLLFTQFALVATGDSFMDVYIAMFQFFEPWGRTMWVACSLCFTGIFDVSC